MLGPHNIDMFSKLTYTLTCHYDSYHDHIVEWLKDSYIRKFQKNGKVMLALFLNDDDKGKYDIFLLIFDILPFLSLIFYLVFIVVLKLLRWLHWKHDFIYYFLFV
jgi:hypothetical protein